MKNSGDLLCRPVKDGKSAHAQRARDQRRLFDVNRPFPPLVAGHSVLGDADLFREFGLSEAGLDASFPEVFSFHESMMPVAHMCVKHMCDRPFQPSAPERKICAMDINQAIGAAIRQHRKAASIPQKKIDYDQGGLSKVENGTQSLTFESLERIAASIGTRGSAILATAESIQSGRPDSHPARLDDETIAQAVKLLHLVAAQVPASKRLGLFTWQRIVIAAKVVEKHGPSSSPKKIVTELLAALT